jgi:sugar/nucleoside kinase (ribokinase family)
MVTEFPRAQVFLTPQGWLRRWDAAGVVRQEAWETILPLIEGATAMVVSLEDLGGDVEAIEAFALRCPIVAVTAGERGAYIASAGQTRLLPAPASMVVDLTGAGDVFAATFFAALATGTDAWEAGRRANILAAHSIRRPGLQGVPTAQECEALHVRTIV